MRKLSRFGAAALAFALSVTFVAPVTANAATETKERLHWNYEFSDGEDLIENDTQIVGGPFENYSDAFAEYSNKGYSYEAGYSIEGDEYGIWYIYKRTYTNLATGSTGTTSRDVNSRYKSDSADYHKYQSSIRIKKGETTYLGIPLINGDTTIKNIGLPAITPHAAPLFST